MELLFVGYAQGLCLSGSVFISIFKTILDSSTLLGRSCQAQLKTGVKSEFVKIPGAGHDVVGKDADRALLLR